LLSDQAANDGAKRERVEEGRYAAAGGDRTAGSIQHQGAAAKAVPAPAPPSSIAEKKATADRPMEESQRQNQADWRTSFGAQKGGAGEDQKMQQAAASLTYRVRFVLRVVSPESSAAGSALSDRASQPAKPAEFKPADPVAAPVPATPPAAPAAAPSK
jgi:hypothetical protein